MRALHFLMAAAALAFLSSRTSVVSADEARLKAEVAGVARGLPFAGSAKGGINDGLKGGYSSENATGASEYPAQDAKPPGMLFGVNWQVGGSGGKPRTAAELDKQFNDRKGGFRKGTVEGVIGQNTWMFANVERGTMDPNMSGDPYMGGAEGGALAECGSVYVQLSISIWSDGSHGARNKPEVLEALKKAVEKHFKDVLGQFLAVLRYGCSGEAPPETAKQTLSAQTSCTSVTLVRGKLPSEECGIYVKGWPANRPVSTCFPDVLDAWGRHPNGIVATFVNEFFHVGAVVANGRESGEYYLPIWWYAQCQAVPGIHNVDVVVYEGGPTPNLGGCPASTNRAVVRFRIEVLAEMSGNCTPRPPDPPTGGTGGTGTTPGMGGAGPGGSSSGGSGTGSGGAKNGTSAGGRGFGVVGRWRTNFGDLVLTDAGGGNVRGTLGDSGVVVIGKVSDDGFVGTFTDANGEGVIHLVSPDGNSLGGEWKRTRGSDAGRSGRVSGTFSPDGGTSGNGTPGTGDLPQPPIGPGNGPGGPGSSSNPPLRPLPAPLSGLTLQAPELRVTPGQEVVVSVWLLNAADVTNMNWDLTFDTNVATESTAVGSVGKGNLLAEAFEANPATPGLARMGFAQKKGITGTGTVSVHRMKVVGAVGSRTPLSLAVRTITDSRPQTLPIAILSGWIEVVAPGSGTPGSGNGQPPTLQDAYNALKMSVGLIPERLELDVDHDGKVTSLDAYLIMTTVFLAMKSGK